MRKKLVSILISMAMLGQMAVPAYASDSAAVSTESPAAVTAEEASADSAEADTDSPAASTDPVSVPEIGGGAELSSPDGSYSPEDVSDQTGTDGEDADSMIVDADDSNGTNGTAEIPDASDIIEDDSPAGKDASSDTADGIDLVEEFSADEDNLNAADSSSTSLVLTPEGEQFNYKEITVSPEDKRLIELKVNFTGGSEKGIKYVWYGSNIDTEQEQSTTSGSGQLTYKLSNTGKAQDICCEAWNTGDDRSNSTSAYFHIAIESDLSVAPEKPDPNSYDNSRQTIIVSPNGSTTMRVFASAAGGVSYQWSVLDKESYSWTAINSKEAKKDFFTINNVDKAAQYQVAVTDQYGNTKYAYFNI